MSQIAGSVWLVMGSKGDGFVTRIGYAMTAAASDTMVAAFRVDDPNNDVYVVVLVGVKYNKGP